MDLFTNTIRYAGIGSRETPILIINMMIKFAHACASRGILLISGGANGADSAFAKGAKRIKGNTTEIITPSQCTQPAIELAEKLIDDPEHWARLYNKKWRDPMFGRKAHGRNMMLILGHDLNTPVDFVVCWTKGGARRGGTATGIKLAQQYEIPVFNLGQNTKYVYPAMAKLAQKLVDSRSS